MNRKGFTLMELLIVVTVLVIIGVAVLTMLNPMVQFLKGYDTVRKADLAEIKAAFEAYYEDHGCYPPSSILDNCGGNDLSPYMNSIPCDPNSGDPYILYLHPQNVTCSQNFVVYAVLSNIFDPAGKEIPYCDNYYAASSTEVNQGVIVAGCSGRNICARAYGCVNGVCQLVGEYALNTCNNAPAYCDIPDCRGYCGPPEKECYAP